MVHLLDTQGSFLSLILKAEKAQRRALIDTLSHDQLDFLGEILLKIKKIMRFTTFLEKGMAKNTPYFPRLNFLFRYLKAYYSP